MKISVVGFFWYRNEEEFEQLKALAKDSAQLPDSYAGFLERGEVGIKQFERRGGGVKIIKVEVDPREYLAWCSARGLNVDSTSRIGFANERALEIFLHDRGKDSTKGKG